MSGLFARQSSRAAGAATLILPLVLAACSSEDEACICTDDYRMITVTVVDGSGAPVDSAGVVVTRELDGTVLPFGEPSFFPGTYVVYNDSRVRSTRPEETIRVSGTKDALSFEGVIQVSVDMPCRCHVMKVGGPDTLVAN